VCGLAQAQVGDGERGEFADSQPGLDGQDQQGVIAASEPGRPVWRGEQRVHFGRGEEADQCAVVAFGRDGQHLGDRLGVLGVAQRGVAEQRVDRGQACVAGAYAVASVALEVGEERGDEVGVEVGQVEPAWWGSGVLLREAEQQPQRVSVGGHGAWAALALG
jgi:hypothetical protein